MLELQPGVQQYPHGHGHRHVQRVGLEGQRTLSIPGPMRSIAVVEHLGMVEQPDHLSVY